MVYCDSAMPKNGPSAEEWKERLCVFANGEFQFYKGQMPAKGDHWGKKINTIRNCRLFKSAGMCTPVTAEVLKCSCGYHKAVSCWHGYAITRAIHAEEIITVGHWPFSGQNFHMTDQKPLWSEGNWPITHCQCHTWIIHVWHWLISAQLSTLTDIPVIDYTDRSLFTHRPTLMPV